MTVLPCVELHVQVMDDKSASNELRHVIHVGGTDLKLPIIINKCNST